MTERQRILVTGGCGYVGSHTCKALARAGFDSVVYDNLSRGQAEFAKYGPFVRGDIQDQAGLEAAIREFRPVACLHFAALAYVGESMRDPALYYRNNVAGTLKLLQALVSTNVSRIVFSSTCAVYGDVDCMPIREEAPKRPLSPYGRTKLVVEQMLEDFHRAHGTQFVVLRYFNAAGADPEGELGEVHDPEPHVIPRALMAAAGVLPSFTVFGSDYPTPDGTAIRDYTHVVDLANAHVGALRHVLSGGASDAFNLGVGRGYSVLEIVRSVERLTGRSVRITFAPRRPGDPAEVIADPSRARQVLGFKLAHPELDDMVGSAWGWFETNGFAATR